MPHQHFPGAQFATESARGPICLKPVLKTRVCNGIHRFQSWLESRQTRRSLYFQLGWSCFAVINITMIIITMIISTKIISTITSLILLMILSLNKRGRAPTSSLGEVVSEREQPLLGYIIYPVKMLTDTFTQNMHTRIMTHRLEIRETDIFGKVVFHLLPIGIFMIMVVMRILIMHEQILVTIISVNISR